MSLRKSRVACVPDSYAAIESTPLCAGDCETVAKVSLLSNKTMRHGIVSVGLVALQLHLLFAELCHGQELRIPHLVLARLEAADETGAFLNYHRLPLRRLSG